MTVNRCCLWLKLFQTHIKVPRVKSVPVFFNRTRISLIRFPEVGTYKEAKHILSTTPGGQISDQKCSYAPIIPLSVPGPGLGGGGFN